MKEKRKFTTSLLYMSNFGTPSKCHFLILSNHETSNDLYHCHSDFIFHHYVQEMIFTGNQNKYCSQRKYCRIRFQLAKKSVMMMLLSFHASSSKSLPSSGCYFCKMIIIFVKFLGWHAIIRNTNYKLKKKFVLNFFFSFVMTYKYASIVEPSLL